LDLSREEHRLGQVLELLEQLEAGGSRFNVSRDGRNIANPKMGERRFESRRG
jgi:hypothetical protein